MVEVNSTDYAFNASPRNGAVAGVVIALGSNTGDRVAQLQSAAACIEDQKLLTQIHRSNIYETAPERASDGGAFANAVMVGETTLSPQALLLALLRIETLLGRQRLHGAHGGPRVIDLDLIFFADRVIDEPGLQLPHPRFSTRAFVLVPLADIAPLVIDPRSGSSIHSLLAALAPATLPCLGSLRR